MENKDLQQILSFIKEICNEKEKLALQLIESKKPIDFVLDRPLKSDQINELSSAMAKAQLEYPRLEPNRQNSFSHSKYADLENLLFAIRPIIAKHGVQFEQSIYTTKENTHWVITSLRHTSGQWSESRGRIIPETSTKTGGYQEFGKALTYQARYAAMSMLGIRPTNDKLDDDDQDNAKEKEMKKYATANINQTTERPKNSETISKDELNELLYEIGDSEKHYEMITNKYDLDDIADLPKALYRPVITRLREIKLNEPK